MFYFLPLSLLPRHHFNGCKCFPSAKYTRFGDELCEGELCLEIFLALLLHGIHWASQVNGNKQVTSTNELQVEWTWPVHRNTSGAIVTESVPNKRHHNWPQQFNHRFYTCAWSSRFPEWRLRLPLFLLYAVFNTTRNATAHLAVGSFSAGWMCFWMVVLVIIIFFRGRYAIYGIIAVDIIKWSTDEEVRPFGVWAGALLTTTYCWMVWIM